MQTYRSACMFALAALAAVSSCEGSRWRMPPARTVFDKEDTVIRSIRSPRGPTGVVKWRDRLKFGVTKLQPWHRVGRGVNDPDLGKMAVVVAKAGSLTKASCPLSPWAKPAREDLMVVFRMNETALMFGDVDRASAAWEREVVVADALPRGSDYVLQFVNCENVGNYTSGADGDSPSALSMELEVSVAETSRLALLTRSVKGFLDGLLGKV